MRKVLLVDDEILVRVGLKSVINWEDNGYVISGEAADGYEALEKIKADIPDIVLTDLMMNRMNGFELIREIKKEYPQMGIVVLSCYNDFDNVREAMRLGAMDYVFKLTLKPDELLKTLKNVEGSLVSSVSPREYSKSNSSIVLKNINAIKANVLKKAMEGNYTSFSSFGEELRELNIRILPDTAFLAVVLAVDSFYLLEDSCKIKEKELLKFSMINITDEVLQGYSCCDVFDYRDGKLLLLFNIIKSQQIEQFKKDLNNIFDRLKEYFDRYLGLKVSAGASSLHKNLQTLSKAVDEAEEALQNRFFIGNGKCCLFNERSRESNIYTKGLWLPECLQLRNLEDAVELMDGGRMEKFVKEYIAAVSMTCAHSVEKARGLILELLYPFINAAKMRGLDMNALYDRPGMTPYQVIMGADTLEHIESWFMEFIQQFVLASRKKNESRTRAEIMQAKEFVKANIGSELNISTVARHVNMSESYFSHLFKKETGESFIDYVNRTRIEKAKEMIINTHYRIYEIASMVGMDNSNYFSLLFKKITGKSPNDYRC